jgi:fibronectin type 3 domain-containing protein
MNYFIISTFLFLFSLTVMSQDSDDFEVYSKVKDGKVHMKIQPLNPDVWYLGKSNGYMIERKNATGDDSFQVITSEALKPFTADRMKELSSEDPFVGELRAILYDMEEGVKTETTNFAAVEEKEKELEGRIFLHFYLSAMSELSSQASGLQFIDEKAKPGQKYIYRISIKGSNALGRDLEVNTFTETSYVMPDLNLTGMDHSVRINWFHKPFERKYIAYRLEKSSDKSSWSELGEAPIVYNTKVSEGSEKYESGYIYEGDSLEENYQPYYYRLKAIDFFGDEIGPGSINEVQGRDLQAPPQPKRVKASYINEEMNITWDYPEGSSVSDLKGFHIGTGTSPEGPFKPVNEEVISPDKRTFIHSSPDEDGRNYYIVTAVDTSGNYKHSLTAYEPIPDKTPPNQPKALRGEVDTNGVVTLKWDRGEADDLMGYRVFRANTMDHEYVQLTRKPLQDTIFNDTLSLHTLTKKVFYKVVAVDNNFNHSGFSTPLKVKRPDIIPPVAPKIKAVRLRGDSVKIHWVPSSSRDASTNSLLRKENGKWLQIGAFGNATTSFTDYLSEGRQVASYAMVAKDESGKISDTSNIRSVRKIQFYKVDGVDEIQATYNSENKVVELSWDYSGNDQVFYVIYRGQEKQGMRMYETAKNDQRSFYDKRLQEGTNYRYAIRVKRQDGKTSPLSSDVSVMINENK